MEKSSGHIRINRYIKGRKAGMTELTAVGFVRPEAIAEAVLTTNAIDNRTREGVGAILDEGWSKIEDVLEQGGLVTTKEVIVDPKLAQQLDPALAKILEERGLVTLTNSELHEHLSDYAGRLLYGEDIHLLSTHADRRLVYGGSSLEAVRGDDKVFRNFDDVTKGFRGYFQRRYKDLGVTPFVAPLTAASSMVKQIAIDNNPVTKFPRLESEQWQWRAVL